VWEATSNSSPKRSHGSAWSGGANYIFITAKGKATTSGSLSSNRKGGVAPLTWTKQWKRKGGRSGPTFHHSKWERGGEQARIQDMKGKGGPADELPIATKRTGREGSLHTQGRGRKRRVCRPRSAERGRNTPDALELLVRRERKGAKWQLGRKEKKEGEATKHPHQLRRRKRSAEGGIACTLPLGEGEGSPLLPPPRGERGTRRLFGWFAGGETALRPRLQHGRGEVWLPSVALGLRKGGSELHSLPAHRHSNFKGGGVDWAA